MFRIYGGKKLESMLCLNHTEVQTSGSDLENTPSNICFVK